MQGQKSSVATTLCVATLDHVGLLDAVVDRFSSATVLLYSRSWAGVALFRQGQFVHPGRSNPAEDVYEARVFDARGELRWWHSPDEPDLGLGRAAYVTDLAAAAGESAASAAASNSKLAWKPQPGVEVTSVPGSYLLWGELEQEEGAAWPRVHENRIGSFPIPPLVGVAVGARIKIATVEYLGPATGEAGSRHGNRVWLTERLTEVDEA